MSKSHYMNNNSVKEERGRKAPQHHQVDLTIDASLRKKGKVTNNTTGIK